MQITLNGIKYNIKPLSNLTTSEYIELAKLQAEKGEHFDPTIDSLAILTGLEFGVIAGSSMSSDTVRRVREFLGDIHTLEEFYANKEIKRYFLFRKRMIDKADVNWQSVGARHAVAQRSTKTKNEIELTVYGLAAMLSSTYDADDIEADYEELMSMNYIEVLTFAAFFLPSLLNGKSNVPRLLAITLNKLKTIIRKLLIKLRVTSSRLLRLSAI